MFAIFMAFKLLGDLGGECAIKPFTINHVENHLIQPLEVKSHSNMLLYTMKNNEESLLILGTACISLCSL